MKNTKIRYLLLILVSLTLYSPSSNAEDINLFGGLIRIKTSSGDDDRDSRSGHYEIIHGRRVWVEDDRRYGHYEIRHGKKVWVEDTPRHRNKNTGHYELQHGKLVWVEDSRRDRGDKKGHYEIINGEVIWVEDNRRDDSNSSGHYIILDGKMVWVEDNDSDSHIIVDEAEEWVLMTRIINEDFDWVIIEAKNRKKRKELKRNGFTKSMTGSKEACYKIGRRKEKLWKKHHINWQ